MKRNFGFTAVSVISRLLVSTFLFLVLARVWGPEIFGTFTFVFSVAALLMLCVDFGFSGFLLREISAAPKDASSLITRSFEAKTFMVAVMLIVAVVTGYAFGAQKLPPALFALLIAAAMLLSFADNCIAPLRAFNRYGRETLVVTAGNAIQFLLPSGVVLAGGGLIETAIAILLSRMLYFIAAVFMLARTVHVQWLYRPTRVRSTLRRVWPYGVDGALTSVWGFIDIVTVRMIFGAEVAGLYSAGQKCVLGASALAPIVGNVMIPRLARAATSREPDTWRIATITGALMAGTGMVLSLPLFVAPTWIVHLAFGSEYHDLANWLPLFGGVLLLRYLSTAFGVILTAIGLQRRRISGQVLAILVYLISMYFVARNGLSVSAALVSLIAATGAMGIVYSTHLLFAVRRSPEK